MDNQKITSNTNTGEIFSGNPGGGYQDVLSEIKNEEENAQSSTSLQIQTSSEVQASPGPEPPVNQGGYSPPPPFAENSFKKYLTGAVIVILIIVLILGFVMLISKLFGKKKEPTVENITLTYWGLWEDKEIIQPIFDDYKRSHPTVTIDYAKQDSRLYRERLQSAIGKEEGLPDIFRFHNTWIPMLYKDIAPIPKTAYTNEEFDKIYYPVIRSDLKVGENYYGIPLMIDGLLLFYNEDMLKSANVKVPKTWIDMQDSVANTKLTVKENGKIVTSGIAIGTADNVEHFSDILTLMMLQNGTQPAKSLFSCSDPSMNTCAVEALTFYHKFAEAPGNSWDDTLDNSIVSFAGEKAAMIIAPSWQAITIRALNPNLKFKTALVPQLPCNKEPCPIVNWASYWVEGVSNKSKNKAASFELLKYLSSAEVMEKLYNLEIQSRQLFGEPYSRMDMADKLKDNTYLAPLMEEASTMKSFYTASRTFDGETGLNTSLSNYLKDAVNSMSKGVSPETALKTADEGFKQVFGRLGMSASQ